MGGERFHDPLSMVTMVFGGSATNDGNWPGYVTPAGTSGPEDDDDSTLCFPPTHTFMVEADKPRSVGDYPVRICAATGYAGAAHAMIRIDGKWYLRRHAPAPWAAKRYRPI